MRLGAACASAASAAVLVALGYAVPAALDVDLGSGLTGGVATRGFHDRESGYRWSRARSEIVFPDPGAGPARLELTLAGFRPRGDEPPEVVVEAGGESLGFRADRRARVYSLETATRGLWSSTLSVLVRSETFVPGASDERSLGVRVHRARLVLARPTRAPLKQVLASALLALLLFSVFRSARAGLAAAAGLGAALGTAYAFLRLETAFVVPLLVWLLGPAWLISRMLPSAAAFLSDAARGAGRAAVEGATALLSWRAILPVALLAIAGTFAAYALREELRFEMGSSEIDPIARGFGGLDRDEGGTYFREARPGAVLDLRDFGGGRPWRVAIRAALDSGAESGELARVGDEALAAELDSTFRDFRFELEAAGWGWRAGHLLSFPGFGPERRLRVASVTVERGRSLPPWRELILTTGAAWVLLGALGASGLARAAAVIAASVFALLMCLSLGAVPVVLTPFTARILLAAVGALLFAAAARGSLQALAARQLTPPIHPAALAITVAAFAFWFLAAAAPGYTGGHFSYHTSIAEEIWRGKFLLYYLPGPENMLARQPQWGDLVVPHPSFYHTVSAPLAALPREWFHLGTKLLLALLLGGIGIAAALVATSAADDRAGVYAAAAVASLPTGYQLLGLGHLMTIFGVFAAALALGFAAIQAERLSMRREWILALLLLTFCFVSYTGSLLFASVGLAAASVGLSFHERELSRALVRLLVAGWGLALIIYYGFWLLPFVRESLPALLSGAGRGEGIDLPARVGLVPGKLDYTFGSWIVPVAAVPALALAGTRTRRALLLGWAVPLVAFSGLDLLFNFLLKHHYFSLPVVAVGLGLLWRWLEKKGLVWRVLVAGFLVFLWANGFREALFVARGGS
jgi:hypothetical protein